MLNTIRPVDRDFGIIVGALPLAQVEQVSAQLHNVNNLRASVIHRCLDKIDIYRVDPYRFGSMSLIDDLHTILLEATS